MKSNGKIRNAETLAKRFGVFVSVGDAAIDLENAKAALAYRQEQVEVAKRAKLLRTMEDYVAENPASAEFFTGKRGREVCRVKATYHGEDYEWCGLVSDMRRTAPFWIQPNEYMGR